MHKEIERKAWVRDWNQTLELLNRNFNFVKEYHKKDQYFLMEGYTRESKKKFRIRQDGNEYWVTYKFKSLLETLEVNDEIEFQISDVQSYQRMMEALGFKIFINKEKKGYRFQRDQWILELSHISDLGDFIEIECLLTDPSPEQIKEADIQILSLFDQLKISHSDIETRYYNQMLLANKEL
ncbi:class IV adenylate cyclase [Spirochaeta cellobiosiphila]|uniref:class IV adenylate cyclase n=1 Tax=Spirochaeta cellobiosiphila TaxID=504483 RepID=UPI0003FA2D6D|nr:class IV adenylate cyclase [Spirochaeta cellobiosiphila]